jgi:hypothetical protein
MAIMWKYRITVLRFLLAILVAYLPLQPLYGQSCCQDEAAAQHANETGAGTGAHTDTSDHVDSDCCCCCGTHDTCTKGKSCASSTCSHALQVLPALTFDAFLPHTSHPATGPPGLHPDIPPHQEIKPPKHLFG